MKKATITFTILAMAFACQKTIPEIKQAPQSWHYFVYSEKAQSRSARTCICNLKKYTYIAKSQKQVRSYQKNNPDAIIQDSVFSTTVKAMETVICGHNQTGFYE